MTTANRIVLHKKGGFTAFIVERLTKPECFAKYPIKGKVIAITVESIIQY